jgi:uncharacterized protein YpmB
MAKKNNVLRKTIMGTLWACIAFMILLIIMVLLSGCSGVVSKDNKQQILIHTGNESFIEAYTTIANVCNKEYYKVTEIHNDYNIVEFECTRPTERIYIGYDNSKHLTLITSEGINEP